MLFHVNGRSVIRSVLIGILGWWCACLPAFCRSGASEPIETSRERPNILFISIDDLRPTLGSCGVPHAVTPHLDRLATRAVLFNRAYCQQAICNASRVSVLTGLRPDSTGVYDLNTHFRETVPEVVTLPEHFKNHGYQTLGFGKIFHPAFPEHAGSELGDPQSWSEPVWLGGPRYYFTPLGERLTRKVYARKTGLSGDALEGWKQDFLRSLATEAPEVADTTLYDGQVAERGIAALRRWARLKAGNVSEPPLFLALGFLKPHLPFVAPKRYWELYDPMRLPGPRPPRAGDGVPAVALDVPIDELRRSYPLDVRVDPETALAVNDFSTYTLPPAGVPIAEAQARRMAHGYYACVSYVDAQVGLVLNELDRLGLADSTIVVVWSDHGFHLGEHGHWGKLTNFEVALRVPLIIRVPEASAAGIRTDVLTELIDLFPSLCELAGLPKPGHLEGISFAPVFTDPSWVGPSTALSQYPRKGGMGYSLRTDRFRFNVWEVRNGEHSEKALELYDHGNDPFETTNLAYRSAYQGMIAELERKLSGARNQRR